MTILLLLLATANPQVLATADPQAVERPQAKATAALQVVHAVRIGKKAFESAHQQTWVMHTSTSTRIEGTLTVEMRVIEFE